MNDKDKTKEQLTKELLELRQKVAEFDKTRAESINTDNKVQTMLDNIVIGVSMISPKMEIVWLNKTFKRWFPDIDIEKKPLCYQSFYAPPKDKICDYCPTVIAFKTGGIHSSETGVCADGRIYNVIAVPVKDERGKIIYVVETVEDITERKRMEKLFQDQAQRNELVLRTAQDGFWICDSNGDINDANDAYCRMVGYSREELLNMNIADVEANENPGEIEQHINKIIETGYDHFETRHRCKGGRIINLDVSASLAKLDRGQFFFTFFRDITERKKAEEELKESNIALKVLLKQREEDKNVFENNILSNIKHLILPYIGKLKKNRETAQGLSYLNILESNLKEIISPFSAKLSSHYVGFTPKEIQIANLIRDGKQDKDIMEILNISKDTAKTHRQNIRKKLGIYGKRTNLRTYLLAVIK